MCYNIHDKRINIAHRAIGLFVGYIAGRCYSGIRKSQCESAATAITVYENFSQVGMLIGL